MENIVSVEEFYKTQCDCFPDKISNEMGHFNVFKLEPYIGCNAKPIPYRRRDFYKISLLKGKNKINYADKVIDVQNQALIFSNPFIPYNWGNIDGTLKGCFCVFTQEFFHNFGNLNQYSIFQPNGTPVFELTDEQLNTVNGFYNRLFEEIQTNYIYKYDLLRTIVMEIIHFAMKIQPTSNYEKSQIDASKRIATLFLELLERQFPIDDTHQIIKMRSASDFAAQLNIHVNHLNRAVKEITGKTTTQLISERILLESKILLKHSAMNISEIAYALDFAEVTHFNNFFKKNVSISPMKYRNV